MENLSSNKIAILGAGPVGSLLSIFLAKLGYEVDIFDKRDDPLKTDS
jgi:kynurenine 3-monooxygenase